jgi:hypothetical protein
MTPVYPEDIKEGTYDAEALSSSPFFKITDARLDIKDGRITALITLSSTSYAYVFPGTAVEAEQTVDAVLELSPLRLHFNTLLEHEMQVRPADERTSNDPRTVLPGDDHLLRSGIDRLLYGLGIVTDIPLQEAVGPDRSCI